MLRGERLGYGDGMMEDGERLVAEGRGGSRGMPLPPSPDGLRVPELADAAVPRR